MANTLTKFVFDKVGIPRYEKFLNLSSLRHKLTSSNIANAGTPKYAARDIDFRNEYRRATGESRGVTGAVTHHSHIPLGQHKEKAPEVNQAEVADGDLNSVDIDQEISNMAQNELQYTIAARILKQNFEGLRKVITSE